jgi:hypothetical protein
LPEKVKSCTMDDFAAAESEEKMIVFPGGSLLQ